MSSRWYTGVRRMAEVDQRDALEVLTRARLIELAHGVELEISARNHTRPELR